MAEQQLPPEESDEEEALSAAMAIAMGGEMRGQFPMSFGKKDLPKTPGSHVHDANKRKSQREEKKKGGVHFGPKSLGPARPAKTEEAAPAAQEPAAPVQHVRAGGKQQESDGEEEDMGGLPITHEAILPAHEKPVTALSLDPKASRMVTGSMDGTIKFFDFGGMSDEKSAFRCLEPVEGHMVQATSFGITGGRVLVICSDAHARIYDRDGTSKPIQTTVKGDMYVRDMSQTKGHTQMLTDGLWHPFRQEHWLTSSLDGTLRIWDMNATPVGMDQVLPSVHVLKTLDKRNVCVGGGAGKHGGLYPVCCSFSPNDAKKIVGGCSDGSVQLFFEKARYQKPDKILRSAHTAPVSGMAWVREGMHCNLLVTRSLDETMKVWDCRMLSDQKGPVKSVADLPAGHEKAGVCTSPDGKYIVVGVTSNPKAASKHAAVQIFDAKDLSLKRSVSLGQRAGIKFAWPAELNQLLVGTSTGEVVMLYSPSLSSKGALHFVGKRAKARTSADMEDNAAGPIFNMTDQDDIKRFYNTGHGNMTRIRRQEVRHGQKTLKPYMPPSAAAEGASAAQTDSSAFAAAVLKMGAQRLNLRSASGAEPDSQKALLKYADKADKSQSLVDVAYKDTQPQKLLDWSADVSEGDKRMQDSLKGDFCRRCGQKVCRCVDYSSWGQGGKRPRTS